jgi:hypothetical protein
MRARLAKNVRESGNHERREQQANQLALPAGFRLLEELRETNSSGAVGDVESRRC